MGQPLSMDLRSLLLAAVDDGMSCRAAAVRFGVAPSTAIRWQAQRSETGDFASKPEGCDMRPRRIEERAADILTIWEARKDVSLEELRLALLDKGLTFSVAGLHRFFVRRGLTRKKRLAMQIEQDRPNILRQRRLGSTASSIWHPSAWCLSTRLDCRQHDPQLRSLPAGRCPARRGGSRYMRRPRCWRTSSKTLAALGTHFWAGDTAPCAPAWPSACSVDQRAGGKGCSIQLRSPMGHGPLPDAVASLVVDAASHVPIITTNEDVATDLIVLQSVAAIAAANGWTFVAGPRHA